MEVRELGFAHWQPFIAAADAVFVTGRGRSGSIAQRWPGLHRPGGLRCFTMAEDGAPTAGLAARPFRWSDGKREHQAHAIGFVFTAPERRGRGLASALLREVVERVEGPLVLWTGLPGFYQRLGWQPGDDGGLLGTWSGPPGRARLAARPVGDMPLDVLEAIRHQAGPRRCHRDPADWLVRPFAAETMLAVQADGAYAVFGRNVDHAILYEMVGDVAAFADLWSVVSDGVGRVIVNTHGDDPAREWLAARIGLVLASKPLALWWRWPEPERWYLPWLDRI